MFFDTHAHVNFSAYKKDADEVIRRSLDNEIWMILVGAEYKTSKRALDLANKYEQGVYAAIGLHPFHLKQIRAKSQDYDFNTRAEKFDYQIYYRLARFNKVVAIGEIGLDYYHISQDQDIEKIKQIQKDVFFEQFKLACELKLPVIIHCREAHDDMLELLKSLKKKFQDKLPQDKSWGVMHCFSGNEDLAWQYFSLGLLISFTGVITFSRQWDKLIRKAPLEKIMIETDCPFMTPEPYRGKRNEPVLVKHVADRIAQIKNLKLEKVANITTENAKELFSI
jgi:TatD DNase family protein